MNLFTAFFKRFWFKLSGSLECPKHGFYRPSGNWTDEIWDPCPKCLKVKNRRRIK